MSYTLKFQSFSKNADNHTTSASFYNAETREVVTAVTKDHQTCSLFCHVLNGEHTAKLKDDGKTITLRFSMNCVPTLCKTDYGCTETLVLSPADGCEDLFNASQLVRTTANGKTERQIAFECEIKTTKVPPIEDYLYNYDLASDR